MTVTDIRPDPTCLQEYGAGDILIKNQMILKHGRLLDVRHSLSIENVNQVYNLLIQVVYNIDKDR